MVDETHSNLHRAKSEKNDEFYTQLKDVEDELMYYREHFENKVVFLNCDDDTSNFLKWFTLRFKNLHLKKLIATHYNCNEQSYKMVMTSNDDAPIKIPLKGNGDFRSEECIKLLQEADIVCTNPPFSLFREYLDKLFEYKKKFLIIGPMNAATYQNIFPKIQNNELWMGFHEGMKFEITDAYAGKNIIIDSETNKKYTKLGNTLWYTNLDHEKRHTNITLYKKYKEDLYPKYDNYDAIEVSNVKYIPKDYSGVMGVPTGILSLYNPEQFEIIGVAKTPLGENLRTKIYPKQIQHKINKDGTETKTEVTKLNDGPSIRVEKIPNKCNTYYEVDGEVYIAKYVRILIKNKHPKTKEK